jgi:YVTN family beta-propeller protein
MSTHPERFFILLAATAGLGVSIAAHVPPPQSRAVPATLLSAPDPVQPRPDDHPSFVNWESPHVHPLDLSADGRFLFACNTADNRLEVFTIEEGLRLVASVPVGLDPVSVRVRNEREVWVVNRVSDDISIVDLNTLNVRATVKTLDEPGDVVFAGDGARAFVSCQQDAKILVLDAGATFGPLLQADQVIRLKGQDPRAMATSPDGSQVYVAMFVSGNRSTILNGSTDLDPGFIPRVVDSTFSPYFNPLLPQSVGINPPNPAPNHGAFFDPPLNPGNSPSTLPVSVIVKEKSGIWRDDNGQNWTPVVSGPDAAQSGRPVGWKLLDHDIARIDASTLEVTYSGSMMHIVAGLAVDPTSGEIAAVGTDGINEVRFEPKLNGIFQRILLGRVPPSFPDVGSSHDLNRHLDYSTPTIPPDLRSRTLGDPRGIAFAHAGGWAIVSGMGSNNIIFIDGAGNRLQALDGSGEQPPVHVGQGPTGVAIDSADRLAYVLNRFDGSISTIDLASRTVTETTQFFDPTPAVIKNGRPFLFDTHLTSGLGQASCASCHVDARTDRLAWDLGNPAGSNNLTSFLDQNLGAGIPGLAPFGPGGAPFEPFHEMKGPMVTQTFQDIIGHEPFHWRGDRTGLEQFNSTFPNLLGRETEITPDQMQAFEDYLETITFPPNPYRHFDNSLPDRISLEGHFATGRFAATGGLPAGAPLPDGNAQQGLNIFLNRRTCIGTFTCVQCHTTPTGLGTDMTLAAGSGLLAPFAVGDNGEHHIMMTALDRSTNTTLKVPQLRNMYQKRGMNFTQTENTAGFGFSRDGAIDSLERFVGAAQFSVINDREIVDLTAFMLAFSGSDLPLGSISNPEEPPGPPGKDTRAAVGWQVTLSDPAQLSGDHGPLLDRMVVQAQEQRVGLIAKTMSAGIRRGYAYVGDGQFQSDHAGEIVQLNDLTQAARPGEEITFTVVALGMQLRTGIDRDEDGCLDFDEDFGCCQSGPGNPDFNQDGGVDGQDVGAFFTAWESSLCGADFNADGGVDGADVGAFFEAWENGG